MEMDSNHEEEIADRLGDKTSLDISLGKGIKGLKVELVQDEDEVHVNEVEHGGSQQVDIEADRMDSLRDEGSNDLLREGVGGMMVKLGQDTEQVHIILVGDQIDTDDEEVTNCKQDSEDCEKSIDKEDEIKKIVECVDVTDEEQPGTTVVDRESHQGVCALKENLTETESNDLIAANKGEDSKEKGISCLNLNQPEKLVNIIQGDISLHQTENEDCSTSENKIEDIKEDNVTQKVDCREEALLAKNIVEDETYSKVISSNQEVLGRETKENETILLVKEDREAGKEVLNAGKEYRSSTANEHKTDIFYQVPKAGEDSQGLCDNEETSQLSKKILNEDFFNQKTIALQGCFKKFHSAAEINECRTLCVKETWANLDSDDILDEEESHSENEMDENVLREVKQGDAFEEDENEKGRGNLKMVQKVGKQDSVQSVYKNQSKAEKQKQFLIRKYFLFKGSDNQHQQHQHQQKQLSVLASNSLPRPALISASNLGRCQVKTYSF